MMNMINKNGNEVSYFPFYREGHQFTEKYYAGADCNTCPYGEECQYGFHGAPDCGWAYRSYTPTPEELEEWKKNGLI